MTSAEAFVAARPKLLGIAYRMLGTLADAEDTVADVGERWLRVTGQHGPAGDTAVIDHPEAWLVTATTRRAMDELRSARRRRVRYPGVWLPEPITDDDIPAVTAERRSTLGMGVLLLLERLTPLERAVFVLHDGFGYRHDEIGSLLDRSAAASRQALRRARQRVELSDRVELPDRVELADRVQLPDIAPPRSSGSTAATPSALVARFLEALGRGDVTTAMSVLAPDVVLLSDGGGVVHAAPRPVHGPDKVARLLANLARRYPATAVRPLALNGQPGVVLFDGTQWSAMIFDASTPTDGTAGIRAGIRAVYLVVAPGKLARLIGPADRSG